jgi:hypothetical protein
MYAVCLSMFCRFIYGFEFVFSSSIVRWDALSTSSISVRGCFTSSFFASSTFFAVAPPFGSGFVGTGVVAGTVFGIVESAYYFW